MITFMYKTICVTNRKLCKGDFLTQISKAAAAHPDSIILREKDLSEDEYTVLAKQVIAVCEKNNIAFTAHYFYKAAIKLDVRRLHLPLHILRELSEEDKRCFDVIGVSCHSAADAVEAEKLGAAYITAGHIYETDCKAGLPGRGLDFLREVKSSVDIPVYAIGGITPVNAQEVIDAGADGVCLMSYFMKIGLDP